MSGMKSPFDILLKINIYNLFSDNLNLFTCLFDFSLNIRIQCMPLGDRRQNTHCDHFVAQCAKMFVALFQSSFFFRSSFYIFQCYAVFCNGSFPRHHDMVELAIGDISAGRPAERFTAHSGSNHLDGNIRRALERRTAAQSNDIGATFRHLRLDFSPLVFSQGIRCRSCQPTVCLPLSQ